MSRAPSSDLFDGLSFLKYNDPSGTRRFAKKIEQEPLGGSEGDRMGWPGPWELIIILIIVVMLFGAKRIPEIMGGVGKGIKTFKKTMEGDDSETTTESKSESKASAGEGKSEKQG